MADPEKLKVWTFWLLFLVLLPATLANLLVTALAFEQRVQQWQRIVAVEQRMAVLEGQAPTTATQSPPQ